MLAVVVAAALVFVLQQVVQAVDRPAATGNAGVAVAPARRGIGFVLRPVHGTIALACRLQSLAPDIAPVVQVLASGDAVLRRPGGLAADPAGGRRPDRAQPGAAIVLPTSTLEALGPAARGALADLLQQLISERPVPRSRLVGIDLVLEERSVARLCTWVP